MKLLTVLLLTLPLVAQAPTETITIDATAPARPFPHYWEQMFGSGRAVLSLRAAYRGDLRAVRQVTGFRYVRFHAVLDDEVGVYDEDKQGMQVYNFSYVDQIYDGLLASNVKPFVELSFMPYKLAAPGLASFLVSPERCAAQGLHEVGRPGHPVYQAPRGTLRNRGGRDVVLRSVE